MQVLHIFKNIFFVKVLFIMILAEIALSQQKFLWPEVTDAVIEKDVTEFAIKSNLTATLTFKRSIIFYNEKAEEYNRILIKVSPFRKLKNFFGVIKTLEGKTLKKFKTKDLRTEKISPGFQLYNDSENKRIELNWHTAPYKIEYMYEIEINSLFFWPDWYPQEDIPVLSSTYNLIVPNREFKYQSHTVGMDIAPVEAKVKKGWQLTWNKTLIPPRIYENQMPPENEWQMTLYFSPSAFTFGDYTGDFGTWEGLAQWYRKMAEDKYALPPDAKSIVRQLVSDADSDYEKIRKIYAFMQENTRYVSIAINIGGWQPHDAQSVFTNKYGDCKDLSTLMVSLLKEVGIQAYPALTPTRDYHKLIKEFPSSQFNHCIAMAPLPEDTVWLECTADYIEAGRLPPSVEGCDVLVIKENGCEIIRTPQSNARENLWSSHVQGSVTPAGKLTLSGSIRGSGNQAIYIRNHLIFLEPDKRGDWFRHELLGENVPTFSLAEYSITNVEENFDKPVSIHFDGAVKNFGSYSSRRLFINPNILKRISKRSIPEDEERLFPVFYRYAHVHADTVEIKLPNGFSLESAPMPQNIRTDFGQYQTDFTITEDIFKYTRYYSLTENIIPAENYEEYRSFIKTVSKYDNTKFVFKN